MKLEHRAIVVTGGASGIGRAMVERFALEGPRGIAVVDRDGAAARAVADRVGGLAVAADLTCEAEAARVIAAIEARYGPIDLCCSNGGIAAPVGVFEVAGDGGCEHWNVAAVPTAVLETASPACVRSSTHPRRAEATMPTSGCPGPRAPSSIRRPWPTSWSRACAQRGS